MHNAYNVHDFAEIMMVKLLLILNHLLYGILFREDAYNIFIVCLTFMFKLCLWYHLKKISKIQSCLRYWKLQPFSAFFHNWTLNDAWIFFYIQKNLELWPCITSIIIKCNCLIVLIVT